MRSNALVCAQRLCVAIPVFLAHFQRYEAWRRAERLEIEIWSILGMGNVACVQFLDSVMDLSEIVRLSPRLL